jgi:MFS family permease
MKPANSSFVARFKFWGLHPNIFFLGLVSFLTDVSSEMIFTLLPLFLANVLGVKTTVIGLIEGVADSTATLLKIASGWFSDRVGKRKLFALLGYGLSTLAKPLMYFATAWGMVLGVRFADRVGKGIRTSPRDALVADSTLATERGKSFGFHRAMDTLGAVVGLGVAALVVFLLQREAITLTRATYQWLVLVGVVPAALAVLLLLFFVTERRNGASPRKDASGGEERELSGDKTFSLQFKIFLMIIIIFTLGNSSDAFLILRAQNLGASTFYILIMLVLFNAVYALAALPAGMLSDRLGRRGVIAWGWGIYALVYLGFGLSSAAWQVWLLFAVYGLYYGATEGTARALVADLVAARRRGTAYGLYHGAVGITTLPASLIAGWLWDAFNPAAPFLFGAGLAGIATMALVLLIPK